MLAGRRTVSSHHADDTKVDLSDLQEGTVQHHLQHAHRVDQAAGQFVNLLKSSTVPLCDIICATLGSSADCGGGPISGRG
jgi:phosphoglycerol transferase MdoB-like AlkP superfamily enzyme